LPERRTGFNVKRWTSCGMPFIQVGGLYE